MLRKYKRNYWSDPDSLNFASKGTKAMIESNQWTPNKKGGQKKNDIFQNPCLNTRLL